MNNLLILIGSLSLSASIIALLLFALKPLYRNRLSKRWQYYVWLVVLVRLLLPFSPEQNLMARVFERAQPPAPLVTDFAQPDTPAILEDATPQSPAPNINVGELEPTQAKTGTTFHLGRFVEQHLFTLWLVITLVLLVRKLTGSFSFARYIRAGRREIDDPDLLDVYAAACEELGVRKPPAIYENKLASSPMLVGVLRPCIILPEIPEEAETLRLVLRHELIHYKRRDILYKWLVQLALCVHWFNPLVYLINREISQSCELSCDEAVLQGLSESEKRRYGDTLLHTVKNGGTYGNAIAAVTLTEDGKNLKERLDAILQHGTRSTWAKTAAVVLSVVLLCGSAYAGAYTGAARSSVSGVALDEPANRVEVQPTVSENAPPPEIPNWAEGIAGGIARTVTGEVLSQIDDTIAGDWANRWSNWADGLSGIYNENRRQVQYQYNGGYLVGVGVGYFDKLSDYKRTVTVELDGKSYTLAFMDAAIAYADDAKAMAEAKKTLAAFLQDRSGDPALQNRTYYVVRSIHYNTDPQVLLRQLYEARGFLEFTAFTPYCKGLPVIEELLPRAMKDQEEMYFLFLAEQLPDDFDATALAQDAADNGLLIALSSLERFLPAKEYEKLMNRAIGMEDVGGRSTQEKTQTPASQTVFHLSSDGGRSITQSSSFQAKAGQTLTVSATSNIVGGTVDLFLFSPSGQEQGITFDGKAATKTIALSAGTWAYNCTGFFESGEIAIAGTVS